jgi:polar amino acid transport system permease protein
VQTALPPPVTAPGAGRPVAIKAIPVRHPWRWVSALVVVAFVGSIVYALATAPSLQWSYVANWFFSGRIRSGLITTIELTAAAMAMGVVLGVILAVMRLSPNPVVSSASWTYIWLFRGTPVLVQLIFWDNISLLFPRITLGIPFGPAFYSADINSVVTTWIAALLGLGLNEAAYMAEIVRAGIISVDHGQTEAAQALGMTRLQTMRRIILPQAMRVIIPPTGNETISMLKTSSLASVIALTELLYSSQLIYSVNYRTIELLMVASIWYLMVTSVLTVIQYYIERRYARGSSRTLPPTPLQRFRRMLPIAHANLATDRPPASMPPPRDTR